MPTNPAADLTAPPFVLRIGKRRYSVPSLAVASEFFSRARDEFFRRGGDPNDLPKRTVHERTGKLIGHVAQNGRIFPGRDWKPGIKPLFDPLVSP